MNSLDMLTGSGKSGPQVSISGRQILIVDDFSDMRIAVRRMLRDLGEETADMASNGKDAIEKIRHNSYDIVLCDYNLGDGKDGQQILEEAHHMGFIKPSCIFIMITAETSMHFVLGAIECQPDDYIAKPFTKELLQHRLAKAVTKKDELMDIYKAMHKKQYADAIKIAEQQLVSKSRYTLDIAKLLGSLYLKTDNYEKASDFFQKLLAQKYMPWAKFGLGQVYYQLEDYTKAIVVFDELTAENEYYLEAYDWSAKCSLAMDDKVQAQEKLATASRISPKTVARQCELGGLAKENGELDIASSAYRSAIQYGAHSCFKSSKEYLGMNEILLEKGDTLKALSNLKEARDQLKETPADLLQVVTATADVHAGKNGKEEAQRYLEQAAKIYQENSSAIPNEASLTLAATALKLDDMKLGTAIVSSLAENNHDDDELLGDLNAMVNETGHADELSEIISSSTEELRALNKKGIQLAESGQLKESLELLEKAAEKAPNSKAFNLNTALACIMLMKKNGADDQLLFKARSHLERVEKAGKVDERYAELTKMLDALKR
ncbi:response regulator [Pseudomonadota bacterium]